MQKLQILSHSEVILGPTRVWLVIPGDRFLLTGRNLAVELIDRQDRHRCHSAHHQPEYHPDHRGPPTQCSRSLRARTATLRSVMKFSEIQCDCCRLDTASARARARWRAPIATALIREAASLADHHLTQDEWSQKWCSPGETVTN